MAAVNATSGSGSLCPSLGIDHSSRAWRGFGMVELVIEKLNNVTWLGLGWKTVENGGKAVQAVTAH